ncbi:MAG: serine/threonine protein kinase [Planctomycetes bacterium]|nr:serine/threonine protein kinase [Planctomycetota bacterium]
MGVVWRARQLDLDRPVAVKMLLAGATGDDRRRRRFLAEARAVARLVHPNIVSIHDVGEHEGVLYFTMDLVEGPSLAEALKPQPFPLARALEVARGILDGLICAHAQKLVHRDLKPANILLDARGTPRITDFGIAKDLEAAESHTITGEVLGTPTYMPPEQADGRTHLVDGRADIYALGAMLYRMIAGRPPFEGVTPYDVISKVLTAEPTPLRKLDRTVPEQVDAMVLRCLAKDREKRYPTAEALAQDISLALERLERRAAPARAGGGGGGRGRCRRGGGRGRAGVDVGARGGAVVRQRARRGPPPPAGRRSPARRGGGGPAPRGGPAGAGAGPRARRAGPPAGGEAARGAGGGPGGGGPRPGRGRGARGAGDEHLRRRERRARRARPARPRAVARARPPAGQGHAGALPPVARAAAAGGRGRDQPRRPPGHGRALGRRRAARRRGPAQGRAGGGARAPRRGRSPRRQERAPARALRRAAPAGAPLLGRRRAGDGGAAARAHGGGAGGAGGGAQGARPVGRRAGRRRGGDRARAAARAGARPGRGAPAEAAAAADAAAAARPAGRPLGARVGAHGAQGPQGGAGAARRARGRPAAPARPRDPRRPLRPGADGAGAAPDRGRALPGGGPGPRAPAPAAGRDGELPPAARGAHGAHEAPRGGGPQPRARDRARPA